MNGQLPAAVQAPDRDGASGSAPGASPGADMDTPVDPDIAAFEQVCETLSHFDPQIGDAEWCDGFLTAVAAGPRAVELDEWLPVLAGDAYERAFADPHDDARARAALGARYASLRRQLDAEQLLDDPDVLHLSPLMVQWDDEAREHARAEGADDEAMSMLHTGAVWAAGFMDGVQAMQVDWAPPDDEDIQQEFAQAIESIGALMFDPAGEDYRRFTQAGWGTGQPPTRDDLIDEAMLAVQDLRILWVDFAPRPTTRRVGPQPGRNDPCPCGSGRKFKKCCGAAT